MARSVLLGAFCLLHHVAAEDEQISWPEHDREEVDDIHDAEGMEQHLLSVAQLRKLHSKFDADGDGRVHQDEMTVHSTKFRTMAVRAEMMTPEFREMMDEDKDGKITLEEFAGMNDLDEPIHLLKAKAADADGDGFLTEQELLSAMHSQSDPKVHAIEKESFIKEVDTNEDGKISKEEHQAHDDSTPFEEVDADRDGIVPAEEYADWMFSYEERMFKDLVKKADSDGDDHMSADEFVTANISELSAYALMGMFAEHYEL